MDTPTTPGRRSFFRRNFATGMFVLAPVAITVYLVIVVVRFIGGFLSPYLRGIASTVLGESVTPYVVNALTELVAFALTIGLIAIFGAVVRRVLGQRLLEMVDWLLGRIPVVRDVYDALRKFTKMLSGDRSGFQRVVAIRFPTDRTWSIGFVTNTSDWQVPAGQSTRMLSVFVPTSPVPTSGFLVMSPAEEVVELPMSVEQAIRLVVSGGTLSPDQVAVPPS
ncbi:DUF502 domain-containing protein [candidate division KSB1 bacterium]|nr:DUF502 domain-containing protein [candidate division KSB1 bacterium]